MSARMQPGLARFLVLSLVFALNIPAAFAQFDPGARASILSLRASYGERGPEISKELVWRIYSVVRGSDVNLVATSDQVRPTLSLPQGEYAIHVSHGLATATRSLFLRETNASLMLPINAGAMMVRGVLGSPDRPLAPHRQKVAVFIPTANNSEGKLISNNLKPGAILRVPDGVYHIVSTYTGSNSVVRSDVRVETGRFSEVVVNHRAATITLKLVRQQGGVALADTQWTVETPGGDIVAEAVGAFPDIDIAEGTYPVIARNNGREYRGQLKVEGGLNRDFEIMVE
jgi:hypothetical protein